MPYLWPFQRFNFFLYSFDYSLVIIFQVSLILLSCIIPRTPPSRLVLGHLTILLRMLHLKHSLVLGLHAFKDENIITYLEKANSVNVCALAHLADRVLHTRETTDVAHSIPQWVPCHLDAFYRFPDLENRKKDIPN